MAQIVPEFSHHCKPNNVQHYNNLGQIHPIKSPTQIREEPFPLSYDIAALSRVLPQILQDTVVVRVDGTYRLRSVVSRPKLSFSTERRIPVKARLGGIFKSLLGSEPVEEK